MKTVKQACALKEDALDFQLAQLIENIDEVIRDEEAGKRFFERTYITQNMRQLLADGMARLAGRTEVAVYHLRQAMGGGKTHLMTAFGFLARYPKLRERYVADLPYVHDFGAAAVAAFNGRNFPNEFFWGDLAKQLGYPDLFRAFWSSGPKAPGESDWLALFKEVGNRPILILLDEMPPYFNNYRTSPVGSGTVADIVTTALSTLLTAAARRNNVCVVISDLEAVYEEAANLIDHALKNARQEVDRCAKSISPVDLSSNDIYEILRKRLFDRLPDEVEIREIANAFRQRYGEAITAKTLPPGADAWADEIPATYPFHPRYKNVIALFKENREFRQTRGVLELTSRLLKSVWERSSDDVYLVGPQHFNFSIPEVREKLVEYSGMSDVIARDIWDKNGAAHAQAIDQEANGDAASQVAALLFTASMSNVPNAVRGLVQHELLQCLIAPNRETSVFRDAFERLRGVAWYLHRSEDERYYFDRQENLTKMLQTLARNAPDNKIDELIRNHFGDLFKPNAKHAYEALLIFPRLEDVAENLRGRRVLVVLEPSGEVPSSELQAFFEHTQWKNNLLVLTGRNIGLADLRMKACLLYAAERAMDRVKDNPVQREELDAKRNEYRKDFHTTLLSMFDQLIFPTQRPNQEARLECRSLECEYDPARPFSGEDQVIRTLCERPAKLILQPDQEYDLLREKILGTLWPENQDEARWVDIVEEAMKNPAMLWVPPRGLDTVLQMACKRGQWKDLGNGYVTQNPRPDPPTLQIQEQPDLGDEGFTRLRLEVANGGPNPEIHYAEDAEVSENSPTLRESSLRTRAMRVSFLVIDPTTQPPRKSEPIRWTNQINIRHEVLTEQGTRKVRLDASPSSYSDREIRYTLDGSHPQDGTRYEDEPFAIGEGEYLLRVYARIQSVEATEQFTIPRRQEGLAVKPDHPLVARGDGFKKIDGRRDVFEVFNYIRDRNITFQDIMITGGQGSSTLVLQAIGEVKLSHEQLNQLLNLISDILPTDAPIVFKFKRVECGSGREFEEFNRQFNITWKQEEVSQ